MQQCYLLAVVGKKRKKKQNDHMPKIGQDSAARIEKRSRHDTHEAGQPQPGFEDVEVEALGGSTLPSNISHGEPGLSKPTITSHSHSRHTNIEHQEERRSPKRSILSISAFNLMVSGGWHACPHLHPSIDLHLTPFRPPLRLDRSLSVERKKNFSVAHSHRILR